MASLSGMNWQLSVNIPASLQLMIAIGPSRFQVVNAQSNHCLDTDMALSVGRVRPLMSIS
ncbi:MAG: hypothetical protein O3A78_03815 [Nitrospinae bacterium]|nr:hypothetical protein [Nitrospinota bacterium]